MLGDRRIDQLGPDMPCDDGVAGRLRQKTAEQRPPAVGTVGEDAQRIEHAVDVERRRLDRHQQEVRRGQAAAQHGRRVLRPGRHRDHQAGHLAAEDPVLRETILAFRADEIAHRDIAVAHGAEDTPAYDLISTVVKTGSRLAIWLSTRL